MKRFNVKNEGWMADILDYFEGSVKLAKKGFYQDNEQPHIRLYKSPEIETIVLYFDDFSICEENTVIENRFELMQYIQYLVKDEIKAPGLEIITGFEYREYQGKNLDKKPTKKIIISAGWQQV